MPNGGTLTVHTYSVSAAGICVITLLSVSPERLPFIRTVTLLLPLSLTAPPGSTATEGMPFKMSPAEPLWDNMSLPIKYTFLSGLSSSPGFSPVTTTSLREAVAGGNESILKCLYVVIPIIKRKGYKVDIVVLKCFNANEHH